MIDEYAEFSGREKKLLKLEGRSSINFKFIKDAFFGGAEKKAGKAQENAANAAAATIRAATKEAKGDVTDLFGQAQQARLLGSQGALDLFQNLAPAQFDIFQQGNVGAQNVLGQGLQGFQSAILGTGLPQAQASVALSPDFSFLQNVQLPDFNPQPEAPAPQNNLLGVGSAGDGLTGVGFSGSLPGRNQGQFGFAGIIPNAFNFPGSFGQ